MSGVYLAILCPSWAVLQAPVRVMVVPGDAEVRIEWSAVPGATGYHVKRSATQGGPTTLIASNLTALSFTETNLVNGRFYFHTVSAMHHDLEGAESDRLRTAPSAAVLDLLPAGAKVEKLATGFQFIEGPAWMASNGGFLLFSDINANRLIRWTADSGAVTFRQPSGQANGNTVDRQGRLITAEHLNRRVSRTEPDGTITPLVTEYGSKRFNAPNDVVVKSDGSTWFTDPNYGAGQLQPGRFVYRFDPANGNGTVSLVATNFDQPNGLCFSPDESRLYVADSGSPHHVKVFDVHPDNTLHNVRVFAVISPGVPDGIRADATGRLFVTAADGVQVFSSEGILIAKLRTPETAANVGFGGPTGDQIFITANTSLYGVTRMPDLVVTAISRFPSSPVEGSPVQFLVSVKNQGTASTVAGQRFRVGLSIGQRTNLLQSPAFDTSLPPDASVLVRCESSVPGGGWVATPGLHTLRAEVDAFQAVRESNERNNAFQLNVNVAAVPLDTDADGQPDADETIAGTSPSDPASVLRILSVSRMADQSIEITWSSLEGRNYAVACKSALDDLRWVPLVGSVTATGPTTRSTYGPDLTDLPSLYFRVSTVP